MVPFNNPNPQEDNAQVSSFGPSLCNSLYGQLREVNDFGQEENEKGVIWPISTQSLSSG